MFSRLRLFAVFLVVAVVGAASAASAQINTTSTLSAATSQTGRLNRLVGGQTCSGDKLRENLADLLTYAYDSYSLANSSGSPVCFEVTLTQASNNLFVVAYLNSFSPADPRLNWVGDPGSSSPFTRFQVTVPAGGALVLAVHEVTPGDGVGQTYTLTASPVAAAVPTLSEWAMILLGLTLAGGAALTLHRRRARLGA